MFFLSISAHLFIYLLVPAFLVICFYFRGIKGNLEEVTSLSDNIAYEHLISFCHGEQNYIYGEEEECLYSEEKPTAFPESRTIQKAFAHPVFYSSPVLLNITLRAPPVSGCI